MKVTAALVLALIPGIALSAEHGSKGFEFESEDGRYLLQIDSRMQFRFSHSSDDNPVSLDAEPDQTSFEFRRACLKVGGHAIHDWLRYYWEFDFPSSRILALQASVGCVALRRRPQLKV